MFYKHIEDIVEHRYLEEILNDIVSEDDDLQDFVYPEDNEDMYKD